MNKRILCVLAIAILIVSAISVASACTVQSRSYSVTCSRNFWTNNYVAYATQTCACTDGHDMEYGTRVRAVYPSGMGPYSGWNPSSTLVRSVQIVIPADTSPAPVMAQGKFAARCSEGTNFTVTEANDTW